MGYADSNGIIFFKTGKMHSKGNKRIYKKFIKLVKDEETPLFTTIC